MIFTFNSRRIFLMKRLHQADTPFTLVISSTMNDASEEMLEYRAYMTLHTLKTDE
jgi:hypothetical protein